MLRTPDMEKPNAPLNTVINSYFSPAQMDERKFEQSFFDSKHASKWRYKGIYNSADTQS